MDYLAIFIVFFSVVDPIGTVPVFIAVTDGYEQKVKRKIALLALLASTTILAFFILAGELILTAMSIPLSAFQIAGGIILFLFAMNMIFGASKPEEELKQYENNHYETAIFPLAIPSIASPGAMLAAVLLTRNEIYSMGEQFITGMILFSVLLLTYMLMLLAGLIDRLIGSSGASVISRVMGMILASVAITNILQGISVYFGLPAP